MKKENRKINKRIIAILSLVIVLLVFLGTTVLAEAQYFTMTLPEGYFVASEAVGDTKLTAARTDGKINFNIQAFKSEEYYEYTEEGLNELVKTSSSDIGNFEIGKVQGQISKINEYPCYELNYGITFKDTNKDMHIRQIHLFEDTYSYIITIGAENEKIATEKEMQDSLNTFKLVRYERNNVKYLTEEEKKDIKHEEALKEEGIKGEILRLIAKAKGLDIKLQILISITGILVLCLIFFLVLKIFSRKGKNKVKKEKKTKEVSETKNENNQKND